MSKELIEQALMALANIENNTWRLSLLRFHNYANGIAYSVRDIEINPYSSYLDYLSEISKTYVGEKSPKLDTYQKICSYDGTNIGDYIYELDISKFNLTELFNALTTAISNPNTEGSVIQENFNAYIISGEADVLGEKRTIKIITLRKPLVPLKHKFGYENGVYKKYSDKVLSLQSYFDLLIIDNTVFLFTLNGEKLFDLERTYRQICGSVSDELCGLDLFTDLDHFKEYAAKGHNPRKFLSYNSSKLEYVKNNANLSEIAELFGIALQGGKIDTSDEKNVDKLVRFLCDKGMVDPVDKTPREVSSAHEWK